MVAWAVELHPDVDAWFMKLVAENCETADLVEHAIDMLVERGPALEHLSAVDELERKG